MCYKARRCWLQFVLNKPNLATLSLAVQFAASPPVKMFIEQERGCLIYPQWAILNLFLVRHYVV